MAILLIAVLLHLACWPPLISAESTMTRFTSNRHPPPPLVDADNSNSSEFHMLINYSQDSSDQTLLSQNSSLSQSLTPDQLEALRVIFRNLKNKTYRNQRIGYAFAYGLIVVISFFGNSSVCKVCLKNMTKTNALIMSLAVSDLLMTVFNIPFNYFRIASFSWPFGSVMCFVVNFILYLVVYISSYTMAIIAVQRYRSVTGLRFETAESNRLSKQSSEITADRPLSSNKFINYAQNLYTSLLRVCSRTWSNCRTGNLYQSNQIFSMRAIFITIVIIWLLSALISALFTFSSIVSESEDILSLYLTAVYNQSDRSHSNSNHTNASSQSQSEPSIVGDNPNSFSQSHSMLRCQNRLPGLLDNFFQSLSIEKVDFAMTVTVFITQYFIPLTISCFLYIRIGKIITRQGKLTSLRGNPKARIRQKKKRRRIIMLVLVVAVFAICWLPIHIFHILVDSGLFNFNEQVFMVVHWLSMSSVCYNPFIYCWLNKNFRKAALRVFCCCCAETDQNTKPTNSNGANGNASDGGNVGLLVREKVLQQVTCFGRKTSMPRYVENMDQDLHNIQGQAGGSNNLNKQSLKDNHKLSNISVMTETTVIPFSANVHEEITSAINVSYEKLEQFSEEQSPKALSKSSRLTKNQSANNCGDYCGSGEVNANDSSYLSTCQNNNNQQDNNNHRKDDNDIKLVQESCRHNRDEYEVQQQQQQQQHSTAPLPQQLTRTNGKIQFCDDNNEVSTLKNVGKKKNNYDVHRNKTENASATAADINKVKRPIKQNKQIYNNNILSKQQNGKFITNEQLPKISREKQNLALGGEQQIEEDMNEYEDEDEAVLNNKEEPNSQNQFFNGNNNSHNTHKPELRARDLKRLKQADKIELQLLTSNPKTELTNSGDNRNSIPVTEN